ncbi:MAG: PEP-CTERM sorting domain-containing protein [Terracidiphilus sp.]
MQLDSRNRNRRASNPIGEPTKGRVRSRFEKKLERYGIAAGALLVATATARADGIVYSGPVDEVIGPYGGSLSFGLDNEIVLETFAYDYNDGNGNYAYEGETYLSTNAGGGIDSSIPLTAGTSIGSSSSLTGSTTLDYLDEYAYSEEYSYSCGDFGKDTCDAYDYYGPYYSVDLVLPNNLSPQYIGLEFTVSGQTYYGWAQIGSEAEYGGAYAELYDFAYDTTPGQSIDAGETMLPTVVPEPSTLSLLALGAVGLLALQRRRKAISPRRVAA